MSVNAKFVCASNLLDIIFNKLSISSDGDYEVRFGLGFDVSIEKKERIFINSEESYSFEENVYNILYEGDLDISKIGNIHNLVKENLFKEYEEKKGFSIYCKNSKPMVNEALVIEYSSIDSKMKVVKSAKFIFKKDQSMTWYKI